MAAAVFLPPADLLEDHLLSNMSIFNNHQERLFFELPENVIESPPESPCYSTTMSDVSGEEFVDFVAPREFSHDAMWGSVGQDLFLSSSVAWIPETIEADGSFDSLVHFASEDSIVAIDEPHEAKPVLMVPEMMTTIRAESKPAAAAATSTTTKRKASVVDDMDERPTKKSKSVTPASSPTPSTPTTTESSRDDPEAKRLTHNVLERRRRNDLKNSYQQLRLTIPSLEDNERAPTGQILIHAVELITSLKNEDEALQAAIATLRAENERLRALYGN